MQCKKDTLKRGSIQDLLFKNQISMKINKGFTLIELMIVVVIIGILAAIAIPNFMSVENRAKESSLKANMHTFQLAIEEFAILNGAMYPSDGDDVTTDTGETLPMILTKWPENPFTGNPMIVLYNSGNITPDIPNDNDLPRGVLEYDSDGTPIAQRYAIHGGDGTDGNVRNLASILKNF